jgi:hypothetical protein
MTTFFVNELSESSIEAAEEFYARILPALVYDLAHPPSTDEDLCVVFHPTPGDHRAWMLAAVQMLARRAAPRRVNGVIAAPGEGFAEASRFLASAPGITGQLLVVEPR